jgi:acetoin utilization deacetylase AcuC-like enzyme
MRAKSGLFHHERCLWHSPAAGIALIEPAGEWMQPLAAPRVAESTESRRRLLSLIRVSGLGQRLRACEAAPATDEQLRRIHTAAYVSAFRSLSEDGGGELGDAAPFGPGGFETAALSAGLAIDAVDAVVAGRLRNAYVLAHPAGHHCLPDRAMGFCLLANIPLAIEHARQRHGVSRVAVIDWDVHHGNGTQAIYYADGDVLTISLHQEGCFPPGYGGARDRGEGAGQGANINVPLMPGSGHEAWLHAMDRIVVPAVERFRPELIVVASGLNGTGLDPLSRMLLHSETYRALAQRALDLARALCGDRLVVVHEGGFSESAVPFCGHAVVEALAGASFDVADPFLELMRAWQPNERHVALQRSMIDEMARSFGL